MSPGSMALVRTVSICLLGMACDTPIEQVRVMDRHQHPSALYERRNGLKEGPLTLYWPGGQVRLLGQYRQDLRDGWWSSFHPDGKRRSLTHYSDGHKEGLRIYWDSLGRPVRSEVFSQGVPNGPFYRLFPNGRPAQHSNYLHGLLEGPHDRWYTGPGACHLNGFYHQGKENGLWTEYDTLGRMVWQAWLKDGEVERAVYGVRREH